MDGIAALSDGSKELQKNAGVLDAGTESLYNGLSALCKGASSLAEGTGKMQEQASDATEEINRKIDEILENINGADAPTISFASEKNTNVSSVQFAIKTAAVTVQEPTRADGDPVAETNFWEKLLQLFGLD